MTNHQWTHRTLVRAYAQGIITAQQLADIVVIYRGLK